MSGSNGPSGTTEGRTATDGKPAAAGRAPRSALILGATGLVGGHLVRQLAARTDFGRRIALGRRPFAAPDGVEAVAVDFERLHEHSDLFAVDHVFCALGTTLRAAGGTEAFRRVDVDHVAAAARLAAQAGASNFVLVSSVGADARSRNFYLRTKGEAEQAVAAAGLSAVHVVRPGLLLGARAESRPLERAGGALLSALAPLLVGRLGRYRPIAAEDVAAAMIDAALAGGTGVVVHHPGERR